MRFLIIFLVLSQPLAAAENPVFQVPGFERQMELLDDLFVRHYDDPVLKISATLWDQWVVGAAIWHASSPPVKSESMRDHLRNRLLSRSMDAEGYVSTHQHRGAAHADGWPFPTWTQAGGVGFHFSLAGSPYGQELGLHTTTQLDGWQLQHATMQSLNPDTGLVLELTESNAALTTPPFALNPFLSPFLAIEWAAEGMQATDQPTLAWRFANSEQYQPSDQIAFDPRLAADGMRFTMIPLYRILRGRTDPISHFQLRFGNAKPCKVTIKAIHSAVDTRHNINNASWILGVIDHAKWTADLNFLRESLPRLRRALRYMLDEFSVRTEGCVFTQWVGHDGRTGLLQNGPDGKKTILHGHGIGSNYWDLLPFGGRDCLATVYLVAALDAMAELEQQIDTNPQWNLPRTPGRIPPAELQSIAQFVRERSQELFWNDTAGRFVAAIDSDDLPHDYGYTFVNLEAIHFGLASSQQAAQILQWIDGKRVVEGDTSQGADIYHFRFAPRASTKRNIDWYCFAWTGPESLPWGAQVQDGGAVLGFSYHDVMARLRTTGPENAWQRLMQIADWLDDVQTAGGYRKYYADGTRGSLQGCGTAGGLGMDCEFIESILVPRAIIDGFAGLRPTVEGLRIEPKLPAEVKSLSLPSLYVHGHTIDVTIHPDRIDLLCLNPGPNPLRVFPANAPKEQPATLEAPHSDSGLLWDTRNNPSIRLQRDP